MIKTTTFMMLSIVATSSLANETTCSRELVSGYEFQFTNGSTAIAGHQANNYTGQGGPFSVGDKVVPQGLDCDLALTLASEADVWNLYATTAWTGTAQARVLVEKVTFVANSSANQSSVANSSEGTSSQLFSSSSVVNSGNYVEMGEWAATEDSEGSTSNPVDDADLIKDDTVHVAYTQVAKTGATWPWTSLVMTPKDKKDMDLTTSTGITVTYKASMSTFVRLNQHTPDIADGRQYRFKLPASETEFSTVVIPMDSFAQASWIAVADADVRNDSEIWAVDFVPNIDTTGGVASITIKSLDLGLNGVNLSSSVGVSSSDAITPLDVNDKNLHINGRETVFKSGEFQLIGLSGQMIKSGEASELSQVLRFQESGVYFLRVQELSGSSVSKLTLK